MKTDTSNVITDGSCYSFNGSDTLRVYKNNTYNTYNLFGNKWELTNQSNYYSQPDFCLTFSQIQNLTSPYDFITPFYQIAAIFSAVLIFYSAYALLIRPFFRRSL